MIDGSAKRNRWLEQSLRIIERHSNRNGSQSKSRMIISLLSHPSPPQRGTIIEQSTTCSPRAYKYVQIYRRRWNVETKFDKVLFTAGRVHVSENLWYSLLDLRLFPLTPKCSSISCFFPLGPQGYRACELWWSCFRRSSLFGEGIAEIMDDRSAAFLFNRGNWNRLPSPRVLAFGYLAIPITIIALHMHVQCMCNACAHANVQWNIWFQLGEATSNVLPLTLYVPRTIKTFFSCYKYIH